MDLHMEEHSIPFPTKLFKIVFNTERHDFTNRPKWPFLEESTETPSHEHRTFSLFPKRPQYTFGERPTLGWQFHRETPLPPVAEWTSITRRPNLWRPAPTSSSPRLNSPTTVGPATTIHLVNNSSGLEKCLWVALGGIVVLILMAFFMKLGKPIRRVRRHLSNTRTSPANADGNLDLGSHVRLVDTHEPSPGPALSEPPPPYTDCITRQCDEEPPPRYSASFEHYKNVEPKVHERQQKDNAENGLRENDIRVEMETCNDSDDTASAKTTELIFDNGRIVERLSLCRNDNNETGVTNNIDVEEQSIPSYLLLGSRV